MGGAPVPRLSLSFALRFAMSSHHGSSGPPPLASPALATGSILGLALLVAGCSSAADLASGESDAYIEDSTGGGSASDSAGGMDSNPTGPATTGQSSGTSGGGETSDGGEDATTGALPEPPPDEPAPVDEAEKS